MVYHDTVAMLLWMNELSKAPQGNKERKSSPATERYSTEPHCDGMHDRLNIPSALPQSHAPWQETGERWGTKVQVARRRTPSQLRPWHFICHKIHCIATHLSAICMRAYAYSLNTYNTIKINRARFWFGGRKWDRSLYIALFLVPRLERIGKFNYQLHLHSNWHTQEEKLWAISHRALRAVCTERSSFTPARNFWE